MKKGSYWFSFLSEKEQKEFRENCKSQEKDFYYRMETNFKSFITFILGAFYWSETPQGYNYWEEIINRKV